MKIDRSLIIALDKGGRSLEMLQATVALAKSLDIPVTAEGVEDADCLASLRELGCDYAQGYFIARPMTEKAFVAYLASHSAP